MLSDRNCFYLVSTDTIEWGKATVNQRILTPNEMKFLQEALTADYKNSNIRLREGEYQFDLARAVATFHLALSFPDVKDIIKKLYGEEKANDIQFVRKIQTILKKMEKSNIVKIVPKKEPWELQRYALSSFKFRDSDKNLIVLASEEQIKIAQDQLRLIPVPQEPTVVKPSVLKLRILLLALVIAASYAAVIWTVLQPIINPAVFIAAFSVATICSVLLGKLLSR
jgi:hypothetical protein